MVFVRLVKALASFAACSFVSGDRDFHKSSVSMTRDGHFQLGVDSELNAPAAEQKEDRPPVPGATKRQMRALMPLMPQTSPAPVKDKLQVLQPNLSKAEGGWYPGQKEWDVWRPAASSFVNRTEDWMTLSQVAAGSVASTRLNQTEKRGQASEWFAMDQPQQYNNAPGDGKPQPQVPPERFKKQPKSWPATSWSTYQNAYQKLAPMRAGTGNVMATGAAMLLGPDCCLLKILYVFFAMEGEDDYPYIPRGCGDFFEFAMNANGIPVPWLLIGGALALVTGTHSTANSL